MRAALARYISALANFFLRTGESSPPREPEHAEILKAVADAHREWQLARTYFEQVTEPLLVDYAILSMGAAEKRYMFFLEEARRHGVHVGPRLKNRRAGRPTAGC